MNNKLVTYLKKVISVGKKKNLSIYIFILFISLITILGLYLYSYVLKTDFFFYADDWAWLYRAQFNSYKDLFSLLPYQIYNDRPVGAVFVKFIYSLFELNNVKTHLFLLAIHICNSILIYLITRKIFGKKYLFVVLSTFLFAINFPVVYTVLNVGSIFDLLGNFFFLLTFLLHIRGGSVEKLLSYFTLILSIRTKETLIVLPLILLFYDFIFRSSHRSFIKRCYQIIKDNKVVLLISAIITAKYIYLFFNTNIPIEDPYHYSFDLSAILSSLSYHLSNLLYLSKNIPNLFTAILLLIMMLYGVSNRKFLFFYISALLLLSPTILISIAKNPLYFYFPSSFMFIGISLFFSNIKVKFNVFRYFVLLISFVVVVLMIKNSIVYKSRVNFTLGHGAEYRKNLQQFSEIIPTIDKDTFVAIQGLPEYFNVFDYGPCYSVKILYRNNNWTCEIYHEQDMFNNVTDSVNKYYVLKYHAGNIYLNEASK